ncbi:Extracellular serine protease [Pseudomonas syringae pv. actinidiae]|uniref:Uncharacterized conserved protein n=1 Tax=Pseudomonas syringae pv. actinidiae TaxID=103796 RepID=A0AAN4TPJ1_PSESF|nr:Extracellular serine protease [Pseudomonas syringae pv. actinidiae]OSN14628.1 Extracellular serine protease [Pseudomonas syringae pv. actinidiae]OSN19076.1 Extracellular serine protease [Pseudomonas syringae pv. actinidiae]OSN31052.1 Extracellular serine protease [Pseudomonas syringae pv. actinidiae]OSN35889.1 Extracellular serine protease [Pseudomonas syringae pv. actinidiae]
MYAFNGNTTLSGDTSGLAGGIVVRGGRLVLSGNVDQVNQRGNTATTQSVSQFNVGNGTLVVNGIAGRTQFGTYTNSAQVLDGGVLAGVGQVGTTQVAAGGTLSPGENAIGALAIQGDLDMATGSRYAADIAGDGRADKINVSGTATLRGTQVNVTALDPAQSYQSGRTYTLLSAQGGVVDGAAADVALPLVNRFNAWRQMTLGLPSVSQPLSIEQIEHYQPLTSATTLEQAARTQLGWITAWRIDRYAFASLKQATFYLQASDTEADETARDQAKAARNNNQAAVKKRRLQQLAIERNGRTAKKPLEPGVKDFDADMAQTQLREAAVEFAAAYRDPDHLASSLSRVIPANAPPVVVLRIITADARVECRQMKAAGQARVSQLFAPPAGRYNHPDEKTRGAVDEISNATQPPGLLRALFDDQVHDSRAWFLYSLGREPMSSYFRERMVFFGEASRRELALNPETRETMLAGITPLPDSGLSVAARPAVMDAQRMAEAQQAIKALWEAQYPKASGVSDALS